MEFNFEEDIPAPRRQNNFSHNTGYGNDSDTDFDELSDGEISKLLIVTQTPVRPRKHDGYDRTSDGCSRVKLSQEIAQVINDGLFHYENDLWVENDPEAWIADTSNNLNVISQEDFDKMRGTENIKSSSPPPPPPSSMILHETPNKSLNRSLHSSKHGRKQPRFYPVTKEAPSQISANEPRKRKTRHSNNPPIEMHVGWIMDSKEHRERKRKFYGKRRKGRKSRKQLRNAAKSSDVPSPLALSIKRKWIHAITVPPNIIPSVSKIVKNWELGIRKK